MRRPRIEGGSTRSLCTGNQKGGGRWSTCPILSVLRPVQKSHRTVWPLVRYHRPLFAEEQLHQLQEGLIEGVIIFWLA
jgi:hypothetical protein